MHRGIEFDPESVEQEIAIEYAVSQKWGVKGEIKFETEEEKTTREREQNKLGDRNEQESGLRRA